MRPRIAAAAFVLRMQTAYPPLTNGSGARGAYRAQRPAGG